MKKIKQISRTMIIHPGVLGGEFTIREAGTDRIIARGLTKEDAYLFASSKAMLSAIRVALGEFERISYQKKADPDVLAILNRAIECANAMSKKNRK